MGPAAPGGPSTPASVAFDSDVLISHLRGDPEAGVLIGDARYSARLLPTPVYIEVLSGARDRAEYREILRFLRQNFSGILPISEPVSRLAVALSERYCAAHPVGVADVLIAASALSQEASLVTGNVKHYSFIRGLRLIPFIRRG